MSFELLQPMNMKKRLLIILAIGLILRLGLLFVFWNERLTIGDEIHYQRLAENILNYHEFSYEEGQPHSLRPPFYPFFLSTIYFLTGAPYPNTIRIVQIFLSLGIMIVLYLFGKTVFDARIGILAAFIFAVYPSFIFFTHLLLSEILFTFILLLFVYFFFKFLKGVATGAEQNTFPKAKGFPYSNLSLSSNKKNRITFLAGLLLGLGSLIRSGLFPFLFVAIIFIFFVCRGMLIEKIKWVCALSLGFILVVSPWTIRNYILFKDLVLIDTIGGMNLYLGNYEHTNLYRAWAAIELTGDKAWFYGHEKVLSEMNEAQKQRWAINKAKEFILNHKWLTLKRALIKAANFWGLEREVIGPIINGNWPRLNKPSYLVVITFFIFSVYGLVLACSVFGLLFQIKLRNKGILFCAVIIFFFTGMHAIVYGHSRYHLPLMPLLAIFASWALMNIRIIWECRHSWRQTVSILLVATLIGVWVWEILFVDGARFLKYIRM